MKILTPGQTYKRLKQHPKKVDDWLEDIKQKIGIEFFHAKFRGLIPFDYEDTFTYGVPEEMLYHYPSYDTPEVLTIVRRDLLKSLFKSQSEFKSSERYTSLYIPGFSTKNSEEALNICSHLYQNGIEPYAHIWRHWDDQSVEWNAEIEVDRIIKNLEDMQIRKINIVAKSIGTYVAIKLLKTLDLLKYKIEKIILMGVPIFDLNEDEKNEMREYINENNSQIRFIHNDEDNHGGIDELRKMLMGIEISVDLKSAKNHSYNYPEDVLRLISS